ncbi:type IV pilin N-terminal domain-containing protein [Euryarchaeota archaeon]|jgi:flagellin-like protein|nr:type IV pilin N-terminal domain-containing protein [Euryarchaeota archaeon]
MEQRIVKNDEGVSPVIAVILMVAITVVLAAVLYVWAASFLEQGDSAPIATFTVEKSSGGEYYVKVIKVSKQEDLAGFKYYLKDDKGSTYVGGNGFGEVALQMISNEEHGVEQTYNGDDDQLSSRASNISADDGSEFPVHFNDNDRDGKLSAGDQFTVFGTGNSANGPAGSGWKLDIQFDATGDIIGWGELN